MVELPSDDAFDDVAFIDLATRVVNRAAAMAGTDLLHLVKIDAWFGDRWFRFAGKTLGALGVWSSELTVPPFHPHRVVYESRYRLTGSPGQVELPGPERLHGRRTSASNLRHAIELHGHSTTFAWYSGGTAAGDRGAIMVYASTAHGRCGWYAGVARDRDGGWRVVKLVGADARLWAKLTNGENAAAATIAPVT